MATSSNGQRHPLDTPRIACVDLFARLQGTGAADMTNLDSTVNGGGEIVSAVHTGTGTYIITFAKKWPQLLMAPTFSFVDAGGVLGFDAQATAIDVTAGTATFAFANNATPADVATTTTVYVRWTVRAVSKN